MNETVSRRGEWEQRYHAGRTGWDRGEPSPALSHWLDAGLVPAGRVLVPAMRALFDPARWHWQEEAPLEVAHPNGFVELGFVLTRL